jgi:hypothetical protein
LSANASTKELSTMVTVGHRFMVHAVVATLDAEPAVENRAAA